MLVSMLLLTFFCGNATRFRVMASPLRSFAVALMGHTTLGRTPVDERSARRRDLWLTNTTLTSDKHPCLLQH